MLIEYPKIETLYARDLEGSKKLIPGVFRNPAVKFLENNYWIFTEKIDGTNIRVHWDGHEVTFHGRTDRAQIPPKLLKYLQDTFGTPEAEEIFEAKFADSEVTLFGEGYGPGIQKGGDYRPDISFILFDVYIGGLWLQRDSLLEIATAFGIDIVPVRVTGSIAQAVYWVKQNPDSVFGTAKAEGLVGKPMCELLDRQGKRIIVKIKCRDFKEE